MISKKFVGAPFGVQTARFDVSGVHPKIKMPGSCVESSYDSSHINENTQSDGCGKYYLNDGTFSKRAVMARATGPGWARAYEAERIASQPHLSFKEEWLARKLLKQKLGPGKYETPDYLQTGYTKDMSSRGICDTLAERFSDHFKDDTPGPGTYGKGGIPDALYQEAQKVSFGMTGILDSGGQVGFNPGLKNKFPGPGTYNHKTFTDNVTENTGLSPFELYSYDRTKPVISGHYATRKDYNLAPGQYNLTSSLQDWNDYTKKKHGKFSKLVRFPSWPSDRHSLNAIAQCPKRKAQPGPGYYNPVFFPTHEVAVNAPPFRQSSLRKSLARTGNPVGPGRYDVHKFEDSKHRNGFTNLFRSKTCVRPNLEREKILRERLVPKGTKISQEESSHVPPRNPLDWGAQRPITVM